MDKKHNITICLGSSCFSRGNDINLEIIKHFLIRHGLKKQVDFRGHLCTSACCNGPVLEIDGEVFYFVEPTQVETLLLNALCLPVESQHSDGNY